MFILIRFQKYGHIAAAAALFLCCSCAGISALWEDRPPEPFEKNNILFVSQPKDFDSIVERAAGLVVVCFTDKYCRSCKIYAPAFRKAATVLAVRRDVRFISVDTYYNTESALKCGAEGIPTTVFIKNGRRLGVFTGPIKKETLIEKIQDVLGPQGK